jgi:hypothetical protein
MDLRQEIIIALTEAKDQIISNIDTEGIRASGRTQESLRVEDRGEHLVLVQGTGGAPFETLQYGREGGKVPYGFRSIIRQWILDKGISTTDIPYTRKPSANWQPKYTPQERGLMSAAGAIAEKIRKSGTDRFTQPNENVYTPVLNELIEKIEKIMLTKITSEIRK